MELLAKTSNFEPEFIEDSPMVSNYKNTIGKYQTLLVIFFDEYADIQSRNNIRKGIASDVEFFIEDITDEIEVIDAVINE